VENLKIIWNTNQDDMHGKTRFYNDYEVRIEHGLNYKLQNVA
jgi:hypothetical protein